MTKQAKPWIVEAVMIECNDRVVERFAKEWQAERRVNQLEQDGVLRVCYYDSRA